jgi:hypothetical protein
MLHPLDHLTTSTAAKATVSISDPGSFVLLHARNLPALLQMVPIKHVAFL